MIIMIIIKEMKIFDIIKIQDMMILVIKAIIIEADIGKIIIIII